MSKSLMCHVVAGYPDADTSLRLMLGLQQSGATAIEVQIPFSDPIADGKAIMSANDAALKGGMTTDGSFKLIKKAREQGLISDVYVMSYLQKARHFGLEAFCQQAAICGVKGLIIPDMPYDSPEYEVFAKYAAVSKMGLVPVISPGMAEKRLEKILQTHPRELYVTSRRGITGSQYATTRQLERFLAAVRAKSDASVMIGFGIATAEDVDEVLRLGDMAVVGSAIIDKFQSSGLQKTLDYASSLAKETP